MSLDSSDPWLTVAEIADELRLTPATIRTWISDGTLQAKRAGKRKWLVRRSELDHMLRGEDYADAPPVPPRDPTDPTPDPPPQRTPDRVTERSWPTGEHQIDPQAWLHFAEDQWETAITESQQAAPNGWFQRRLQLIARAATVNAGALERLDADQLVRWGDAPPDGDSGLSCELRPDANRPGPPELWKQYDGQVRTLGAATEAGRAGPIGVALNELAITLYDIVEELERYRGSYGDWFPHPPEKFGGEPPKGSDQDPPTTDESVS
jgi:excisionase family DNA binding protein